MEMWRIHGPRELGGAAKNETGGAVSVAPSFIGAPTWRARLFVGDRGFSGPDAPTPREAIDWLFSDGRPCRALSGEFRRMRETLDRAALAQYASSLD
jgi:hypothetical protein